MDNFLQEDAETVSFSLSFCLTFQFKFPHQSFFYNSFKSENSKDGNEPNAYSRDPFSVEFLWILVDDLFDYRELLWNSPNIPKV
jgi:hypothetical protein